ncbi:MAG: hypothetical protein NTX44_13765 [Ignavibacteriales bacterium]|nr:hypothetical protein [Ignavibacteriales bacterium]
MKNILLFGLVVVMVLSIFIGGCKKDDSSTPSSNDNSSQTQTGTITVDVGSGLTPTYTWAGGGVLQLNVTQVSGTAGLVWGIASNSGSNNIASPVTHGTVPSGTTQTTQGTAGRTLTAGASYTVTVMRSDGTYGTASFSR